MSERKPFGVTWNSWIDRQVTESRQRGEFDDLPGKGKAFTASDHHYDENWWIKSKMREDDFDLTPQTIKVRKKTEDWLAQYHQLPNLEVLTFQAKQLNQEITQANRGPLGPLSPQALLDIEKICQEWQAKHANSSKPK